ncbi:MAG: M20/M25/M40 family metallo-hydrolase [Proteobacteria bacterium]|nr:M20/M25/M40 family metallo-hydrolase [Pseudomonadota bacterium]
MPAPARHVPLTVLALLLAGAARAAAPVEAATVNRLTEAEFSHGEVVEIAAHLADSIGGRLTNSPAMRTAERWAQERLQAFGLRNVHTEGFDFGRGWWIESSAVRMVAPRPLTLRAIPVAWTPPTAGALAAAIVVAPMRTEQDFAAWRGKLAGRIVLVSWPEPPRDLTEVPFQRLGEADLARHHAYAIPHHDPEQVQKRIEQRLFASKLDAFLAAEGALAWARMSPRDGHLVHGEGYSYRVGHSPKLPGVEIAAEDYRRLARLAKLGEVRLEVDSRVHYVDDDTEARNVFAELPGRDGRADYVMAGAHLDSWVAGDGAADNGAGSAVVLEAARLLASLDVHPRRTIRFALWAGEEQGLLGSADYVRRHLAQRPPSTDAAAEVLGPYYLADTWPVTPLKGYADLAAYFNIDNGSGKVRGVYAEDNLAAAPVLRSWLAPFESLGVSAVVSEPTGGTDHVLMSRIGLAAFQFIQDPLDYETRVHHSDVDTFDHLRADDLRQAVVILATLLLDAANAEEPLPRRPVPSEPKPADPFHYPEPAKP